MILRRLNLVLSLMAPLGHCGNNRLYDTINSKFYIPGLMRAIREFECSDCQFQKQLGAGYGELPPREARLVPWDEVAIDLIGPWKVNIQGRAEPVEINALTCIDPVTNLVELIRVDNKTAKHVAQQFNNVWLSRYPRPNRCVHDNGGEFVGEEFQLLLQQHGIKEVPTTSRNPQANSVCERMHQTVANMLRTSLHSNVPQTLGDAEVLIDAALAAAMHATRCSVNRTLNTSPGGLVFHRDMILDIPIIADLQAIQNKRQVIIDNNLMRQNQARREHYYRIGDRVLIKIIDPKKMQARAEGPYVITTVYQNGTVDLEKSPGVTERINIRRIIPFK